MNTCNNVHQKWPIYQEFLTHLADFFCMCMYTNVLSRAKMAVIRNVHLSSGPLKWSALYMYSTQTFYWSRVLSCKLESEYGVFN